VQYIENYANKIGAKIKITSMIQTKDNQFRSASFNAFITSFSDSFSSTWNSEQVYGRQDPIGTFQGTTRKISIGFDIPSIDPNEGVENLQKINQLTSFLYPAYSTNRVVAEGVQVPTNALSISKSPLVRIKFANLIDSKNKDGLLGWIDSFSAIPDINMGMYTLSGKMYPKVYNVSINFNPQHEFDLGVTNTGSPLDSNNFPTFPYKP
jgi:hypothetical protein